MATTCARFLLLRQQQRRSLVSSSRYCHTQRRTLLTSSRLNTWTTTSQHSSLQCRQPWKIQRRHYIFLPSDWSELNYRWKLWWQNVTPTKVKLRWQSRRDRLKEQRSKIRTRYLTEKSQMQARYATTRRSVSANYQFQKLRFQRRYKLQSDYWKRRYTKPYQTRFRLANARFTQRRQEFTKRWSARRKDMVQDSRTMWKRAVIFKVEEYAQPDWFDATDGRALTSRDPTGRFVNPWLSWSTNGVHSISNILKWRYQRGLRIWQERGLWSLLPEDLPQLLFGSAMHTSGTTTPTSKPNRNTDNLPPTPQPTEIQFTWIGHSTCLVQMGNATILTDPIFSHRCTPFARLPGVGVAREVPPSITIEDLPDKIDVCLISHDHYDHLDQLTVLALRDRVQHWVLPKGLPEWLESRCSVDPSRMVELEWWESVKFMQQTNNDNNSNQWHVVENSSAASSSSSSSNNNNTMTVTCCPAQHWSSRTFFDRCKRLWCGFSVETQTQVSQMPSTPVVQKFFFAGDTGMPQNEFPLFSQIGDFCGRGRYHEQSANEPHVLETSSTFHPFDLAAIPIGAYDPSFLMQDAHMNPEEAVQCARQLQARKAVAIHWGTFALSEEPLEEPPQKLKEALDLPENSSVDFVALPIGGALQVPAVEVEGEEVVVESPAADSEAANFA